MTTLPYNILLTVAIGGRDGVINVYVSGIMFNLFSRFSLRLCFCMYCKYNLECVNKVYILLCIYVLYTVCIPVIVHIHLTSMYTVHKFSACSV